jgi:hydroxyacylglutathione hydrolase
MLEAIPVPALADNYVWVLKAPDNNRAAVVDPGEAGPALETLADRGLHLAAVLITHRHGDHVAGLDEVKQHHPDVPVYGPASERIDGVGIQVAGGDRVNIDALGTDFEVIETPGHTLGHIAYHGSGVVLCGDTLFAGGCGRVFEGSNEQMLTSLDRLAALPDETLGCCGHEYTLKNLAFARAVEPDNAAIEGREARAQQARQAGHPTVPFELGEEHTTNPFLRCDEANVWRAAERRAGHSLDDRVAVFGVLRDWKNRF